MNPSQLLVCEEPVFRHFWYPVSMADDLIDEPVAVRLLGEQIVLWRGPDGVAAAAIDRCPHRYARLSGGWVEECRIVCPYHGWQYGSDGVVVHIPQLDDNATLPGRAALTTVAVAERHGWIWACLEDPLLAIPDIAEFDAPGWRAIPEPASHWSCPAQMIIENNLDPAHIAFVHRESFGSPEVPGVPLADVERTASGLRSFYEVEVQSRPGEDRPTVRRTQNDVYGPLLSLIRIDYPDGVSHLMVKACTPVDNETTVQFQVVLRNDAEEDRPGGDIVAFDAQVWDEDRAVLEPADHTYPLDLTQQVNLRIDKPSIEYRRMLAELVETGRMAAPG